MTSPAQASTTAPDGPHGLRGAGARWELYRLLGEPIRLRLLALAEEDELSVGELADLLGEPQPNVSRHVSALRRARLLSERKHGTRVFVRLADEARADAVVGDAVAAGRAIASTDGSLARVADVVRARDAAARAYFAKGSDELEATALAPELPTYLAALAPLVPHRALAVDVGTGDGRLLDVLAPIFERVLAVDRSDAQLARAARRVAARGYENVQLVSGELDDVAVRRRVEALGGADLVLASRVLHHAPRPDRALAALAALTRPGGAVVVVDYAPHDDERLRETQADHWLGFSEAELAAHAAHAGLERPTVTHLRTSLRTAMPSPDARVPWHVLVARKPTRGT